MLEPGVNRECCVTWFYRAGRARRSLQQGVTSDCWWLKQLTSNFRNWQNCPVFPCLRASRKSGQMMNLHCWKTWQLSKHGYQGVLISGEKQAVVWWCIFRDTILLECCKTRAPGLSWELVKTANTCTVLSTAVCIPVIAHGGMNLSKAHASHQLAIFGKNSRGERMTSPLHCFASSGGFCSPFFF